MFDGRFISRSDLVDDFYPLHNSEDLKKRKARRSIINFTNYIQQEPIPERFPLIFGKSIQFSDKLSNLTSDIFLATPTTEDDFYRQLLDWSAGDMIGFGCGSQLFVVANSTLPSIGESIDEKSNQPSQGDPILLFDLEQRTDGLDEKVYQKRKNSFVSSIAFSSSGEHICCGTGVGSVHIVDVEQRKVVYELTSHNTKVNCMSWHGPQLKHFNSPQQQGSQLFPQDSLSLSSSFSDVALASILATASHDGTIYLHDPRIHSGPGSSQQSNVHTIQQHTQDVCGLSWNCDHRLLASGGNENMVFIWDVRMLSQQALGKGKKMNRGNYLHKIVHHASAVRALAFSPVDPTLLVTGGGSTDRRITLWRVCSENPLRDETVNEQDNKTPSQKEKKKHKHHTKQQQISRAYRDRA
ncbi:MAG: putative cell division cycle protein 20 [Streblomastix strix]|uniref:Putative cell division cycle protein 20 n=1 Tax=Streblomastix strix TaxID=222440 RepID=A0A5J4WP03_9EUKA|nr:MAG: putative cell division cycle protein 20 [Streblomastix strix]